MNSRQNGFLYVGVVDRDPQFLPIYLFFANHDSGNKHIKGIFVNNVEHKLSQYADDTEFQATGNRLKPALQLLIISGKNSVYI